MSDVKTLSGRGFVPANERYDLSQNRVLAQLGIRDHATFVQHLTVYLSGIPELEQIAAAASKHDLEAVLSGGCARAIVTSYIKDAAAAGRPTVRPTASLYEMLEGSDVDVLVSNRGSGGTVSETTLQTLASDLNKVSGAALVSTLPSLERRLYSAEWDVVDAREFAQLNTAFGGDTSSLLGLGLTTDGTLMVYDPQDALGDILHGRMRYAPGKDAYGHQMVVEGKFDPSLDGLRLIRMAGQMREVGVEMDDASTRALNQLGDEANRRAWEVQARMAHSPGEKLTRRWAKYAQKIWLDHKDPGYARSLLQGSGYLEVLTLLGLREHVLDKLPAARPDKSEATPAIQQLARKYRQELDAAIVTLPRDAVYVWQPSTLAELLTEATPQVYGADAGPMGRGLYVSRDQAPKGGLATNLLETKTRTGVRVLDLGRADDIIAKILDEAKAAYLPRNGLVPLGDDWRSQALSDMYLALGVDGGMRGTDLVLTHAGAMEGFTRVQGLEDGIVEQLRVGGLGDRTEQGVRALLAMRGRSGFEELQFLLTSGAVTLDHLFPLGTTNGGLFADVPTVEPSFAAFLQSQLAARMVTQAPLSDEQADSVQAAIRYLRGDLPTELQATGTGGQ